MTALRDAIKRMIEDAPDESSVTLMTEVIRRLLAQTEWQPIETAPKDGTVFVAVHNRGSWRYAADPRRINCRCVYWLGNRFKEFGPDSFDENELTHWMPLLEPPTD